MEELLIEPALSGINSAKNLSQRIADQLELERAVAESRAQAKADAVARTGDPALNGDSAQSDSSGRSFLARPQGQFIGDAQSGETKPGQVRARAQQALENAARAAGIEPRAALDETHKALAEEKVRESAAEVAAATEETARSIADSKASADDAVALDDTAPVDADDTAASVSTQQPTQSTATATNAVGSGTDTASGDAVETQTTDAVSQKAAGEGVNEDRTPGPGPAPIVELPLGLTEEESNPADAKSKQGSEATPTPLVELPLNAGPVFDTKPNAVREFIEGDTKADAAANQAVDTTPVDVDDVAKAKIAKASEASARPTPEPLVELPLTNGPAFEAAQDPKEAFLHPDTKARDAAEETVTANAADETAVKVDAAAAKEAEARGTNASDPPLVDLPLTNGPAFDASPSPSREFIEEGRRPVPDARAGSPEAIIELPLGSSTEQSSTDVSDVKRSLTQHGQRAAAGGSQTDPEPLVELPLTNGPAFEPAAAPQDVFLHRDIRASLGYAGKNVDPSAAAAGTPAHALGDAAHRTGSDSDRAAAESSAATEKAGLGSSFRTPLSSGSAVLLNEYDPTAPASPRIPAGGLSASLNKLGADSATSTGKVLTDAG